MKTRTIIPTLCAALLAVIATGCTNDPLFPEKSFTVKATGLPVLEGDYYYELWFSYPEPGTRQKGQRLDHGDADFISVGTFRVDAAGNLTNLQGGSAKFAIPDGYNPGLIADAILTLEREQAPHTIPGRRLLSGIFAGTSAQAKARMIMEDGEAFGEKLKNDTTGAFMLDAPTSDAAADSVNGLWFISIGLNTSGNMDTTSGLPFVPQPLNLDNPDWTYQAWLVRNEGTAQVEYIKMGVFNSPDAADANGAGPGAGPLATRIHPAPGEDFVNGTRRVLNDGTYGLIVAIDPTESALTRPLVPLLKLDRIPSGLPRLTRVLVPRVTASPSLEVTVDR